MCFKTKGLFKCGKCPECLQERRTSWALRLTQESRERRCFSALLTYSPYHVPMSVDGMSLCKRDVQLFLKRLRHLFNEKFSYYIAGEYSPEAFRPHYHCLFFGFPENLSKIEIQKTLSKAWGLGFIGSYSDWLKSSAQITYATNYIINLYEWPANDKRVRPFNLISKGLALDYHPDSYNKKERTYDPRDFGWKWSPLLKRYVYFTPYGFSDDFKDVILDNDEIEYLDSIKVQQTKYNFRTKKTTLSKVQSFKMPRVWRERLLTPEERDCLTVINAIKAYKREDKYREKYEHYDDLNKDLPMWKQIKIQKWKQRKKTKKDKLLSNPEHYIK